MKCLVVTAAGISSRFNEGYSKKHLKCIYYEERPEHTLIYHVLDQNREYDRIVIVGGYEYSAFQCYVQNYFADLTDKIVFLENPHYRDYGTAYSLKLGLETCLQQEHVEEIFFTEGDLYVGEEDYRRLKGVHQDCFTFNCEPIVSKKAVVVYRTEAGWHYAFDPDHYGITMPGNILEIYNSAQMWKFCDIKRLKSILGEISEEEWKGTNLSLIQKYFRKKDVLSVGINQWVNCNTREDYQTCEWGKNTCGIL